MNTPSSPVFFREEQRWRNVVWVMLIVLGLAAIQWYTVFEQLIRGRPVGNNPAPDWMVVVIFVLFGLGLPWLFWAMRLVVEVHPDAVVIRYWPLLTRTIPMNEIVVVESRTYQPLLEFGGWGIRGTGGRVAYNVAGNQGVELTLNDGRRVIIGSQKPDELAAMINALHRR